MQLSERLPVLVSPVVTSRPTVSSSNPLNGLPSCASDVAFVDHCAHLWIIFTYLCTHSPVLTKSFVMVTTFQVPWNSPDIFPGSVHYCYWCCVTQAYVFDCAICTLSTSLQICLQWLCMQKNSLTSAIQPPLLVGHQVEHPSDELLVWLSVCSKVQIVCI